MQQHAAANSCASSGKCTEHANRNHSTSDMPQLGLVALVITPLDAALPAGKYALDKTVTRCGQRTSADSCFEKTSGWDAAERQTALTQALGAAAFFLCSHSIVKLVCPNMINCDNRLFGSVSS